MLVWDRGTWVPVGDPRPGLVAQRAALGLQSACSLTLEGVIAKRADAPYESRRTDTWLKLKCRQRQEFVVGGFTDRKGSAGAEVGSLLLGVHDAQGRLVPVGGVGTGGYDDMEALQTRLHEIEIKDSPFKAAESGTSGMRGAGRAVLRPRCTGSNPRWWPRWVLRNGPPTTRSGMPPSKGWAATSRPAPWCAKSVPHQPRLPQHATLEAGRCPRSPIPNA